ncbi:DUF222 domain-containing protein [Cryobacterium sp. Hb1]|uniref:DUF222 domain-containing protein n=1 Tax=Cryobacterium sp. Hb1 TaxID=1259147 RepID=UPI0010690D4B|nr:DUF222 domain-containing protein [Cryobacterium sp. Hb1]TFD67000.1 DUF222 domain-containing protein [Cryobacterium sp. Hb1]
MTNMAMELTRVAADVAALGGSSAEFATLSDAEVLAARGPIADLLRLSNTVAALLAGTIAERSRPQLGQSGLAARHGFGNPTLMVQHATGLSRIESGRLLAVGMLMSETEKAERSAAEVREAERAAASATEAAEAAAREAAADTAADAQREMEWQAAQWEAREADRAAAWAELNPDLPLLDAPPRPFALVDAAVPIVPIVLVPPPPAVVLLPVVIPWQAPIMHAVAAGTFSPGVGDALLRGLGTLDQAVTADRLAAALRVLLVDAPGMNTEQAYKRARRLRDELDAAGILAREKQARDDTTWSLWRRADGMVTLHALLPAEQGEMWIATYDALTSPRRGGVRFVDPKRAAWAQSVKDDPRTVDQIAADSFTQLLKLGADADPNTLFGGRRPVVRVIVTEHDRPTTIQAPTAAASAATQSGASNEAGQTSETTENAPLIGAARSGENAKPSRTAETDDASGRTPRVTLKGSEKSSETGVVTVIETGIETSSETGKETNNEPGPATDGMSRGESGGRVGGNAGAAQTRKTFGYFEGNPAAVSGETISRHLCDTGYLGILFSQTGQPLNVGREQRLFNREQRRALAVRDGGCRWPGCEQPPSWTEAHHIENWVDLGLSNIDQAILLCAHHHLLLHNRHWKVLVLNGQYWLQPPVEIDPKQTLIALPSKNPLMDVPIQLDVPRSTR